MAERSLAEFLLGKFVTEIFASPCSRYFSFICYNSKNSKHTRTCSLMMTAASCKVCCIVLYDQFSLLPSLRQRQPQVLCLVCLSCLFEHRGILTLSRRTQVRHDNRRRQGRTISFSVENSLSKSGASNWQ